MFTLYSSDIIGNPGNCSYPNKNTITDATSLQLAVCHDYVCAEYKNNYRNGDNFLGADCLPVDCDNDHSENPADWVLPADVADAFPDVSFAVHYSRYNMREKNGKPARPKFHILFPIEYMTDAAVYSDMKKLVNSIFPYFDTQALDAARFFFGTASADVELFPGSMNLTEFLEDDDFDADMPGGHQASLVIPEGSRNATMSRFAGRVIKKYGDSEEAYQCFLTKPQNAHRRWRIPNFRPSGTAPSGFTPESSNRPGMFHRRSTTTIPPINRQISPMSVRPRCWRSTSPVSCDIHRPRILSGTQSTTGRKQNPAHRRSPMS
jgi:hypothetical protein